jgi:hypothetical protein
MAVRECGMVITGQNGCSTKTTVKQHICHYHPDRSAVAEHSTVHSAAENKYSEAWTRPSGQGPALSALNLPAVLAP